jgi:hypothetical protein
MSHFVVHATFCYTPQESWSLLDYEKNEKSIKMSLFSLIPDILPMIMPSAVQITKATDLEMQRAGNQSPMIRQGAVIGKSDKMCATGEISATLLLGFAGSNFAYILS